MKTIQVTDEMYEKLCEISKEMKSQDNAFEASPYMIHVAEMKDIPAWEGCGSKEYIYSSDHETEISTEEDAIEFINNYLSEDDQDWKEYFDSAIEYLLSKHDFEWYESKEERFKGQQFFTIKAAEDHIKRNGHNLLKPHTYHSHSFRNPEMKVVHEFLKSLTD